MTAVFQAVADGTRRAILESLRRSGPQSLSGVARELPMSRQAVTRHLDVLQRAGLLRVERRGRERIHHLEAAPLRELEAWLEPYARFWDVRLERLRRHLEEKP